MPQNKMRTNKASRLLGVNVKTVNKSVTNPLHRPIITVNPLQTLKRRRGAGGNNNLRFLNNNNNNIKLPNSNSNNNNYSRSRSSTSSARSATSATSATSTTSTTSQPIPIRAPLRPSPPAKWGKTNKNVNNAIRSWETYKSTGKIDRSNPVTSKPNWAYMARKSRNILQGPTRKNNKKLVPSWVSDSLKNGL